VPSFINYISSIPGGYLYIDELLKLDQLKRYNLEDVMAVVDTNDKNRYHVEKEQGTGRLKIRANQGHSIEVFYAVYFSSI